MVRNPIENPTCFFPDGVRVDELEPGHGDGALHRRQDGVDGALDVGEADDGGRGGLGQRAQPHRRPRDQAQRALAAQEQVRQVVAGRGLPELFEVV